MTDTAEVMRMWLVGGVLISALVVPRTASAGLEHINDRFGAVIAGDGDRVAVAAPGDNGGAVDGGAVYVYVRDGDGWVLEDRVVAAEPIAKAEIGSALALSGDTLAVALPFQYGEPGSVLVFERGGDGWRQVARVTSDVEDDLFGAAIALSGDVLAVATGPRVVDEMAAPGQVHVFHAGAGWDRVAALQGSSGAGFDYGCTPKLALKDDLLACIVPTQEWETHGASLGSRIAVFVRDGDAWRPGGDIVEAPEFGFADIAFDGTRMITRALELIEIEGGYDAETSVRAYLRDDDGWSLGRKVHDLGHDYPYDGTFALAGPWLAFDSFDDGPKVTLLHREDDEWKLAVTLPGGDMDHNGEYSRALALATGTLWIGDPAAPSRDMTAIEPRPDVPEAVISVGSVRVHALSGEFAEEARFDPEYPGERSGCRIDAQGNGAWVWLVLPMLVLGRRRRT